jgi:hypothetical protein
MMMTDKALEAKAITQEQAEELENWIDESIIAGKAVDVPEKFAAIMDICAAYNMQPVGVMQ